jgi:transcriptional regulator with XRE-family HTH domain/alkylhydroperoxidase/carboxymuconolactone decarboxylase family protein YurZ
MPQPTDDHIGTRLRDIRRRRGLSQRDLATASGVSLSLIRQLEQQNLHGTRMETARKLAVALRVTTSTLLRHDTHEEPDHSEPWRVLRDAVEAPAVQLDTEPTVDGLRTVLAEARAAFFESRMTDVTALLPSLLRDAEALGDDPEARAVRAHLLQLAGSTLTQARQFAAAETALTRALDAATDRLRAASIVTTWTWLLVRQGRVEEGRDMAVRWADDLEPRMSKATPEELAAWGWLLLQVAAAGLRDARDGEAGDAMRLARSAAVLTGRELPIGSSRLASWGPVTVAYKCAERGVVQDRPEAVLATAPGLKAAPGAAPGTEYHRHRLDVAKAYVMLRQHGEAVEVLADVRERAPEWLAQQRYARDILGEVVSRRRTLTPQMRELADAVGLPM